MTFARFMDRALYDPEHGYYASTSDRLGPSGDFFTASDVGTLFGGCVARQIEEFDARLGSPDPIAVIEFGAGRGLLARDVLEATGSRNPDLAGRLRYVAVDRSAAMRRTAAANAPAADVVAPDAVPIARHGVVLAVELFDALPVHRVRRQGGTLREIGVALDDSGRLCERDIDPGPEVVAWAERYGAAAIDGTEAECCPALVEEVARVTAAMRRGYLVVVDYGDTAESLYGPARSRGTLLAYHRHETSERYLERVGRQDLTAHVNLTALADAAADVGFTHVGTTTQDRFLIANGILEPFEAPDDESWQDPGRVRERMRAMQLIHPHGMGRAFRIAVFARGVEPGDPLRGLADPFAR